MKTFSPHQEKIILWAVAFLFFMEMLDGSILNTSFPQIAFSLGVHPIALKVALTSYMLSLAVLIPISGWLADRFGVRRILVFAITLFLLGSIGCGFAQNLPMLVVFRILQGLGGSFMAPVGRLVILRVFGSERLLYAMMRVITLGLIGSTLGPMVGGALTTFLTWRFIFFINIPFCIVPLILIIRSFPSLRQKLNSPFDLWGFILFSVGLGVLLYVVDVAATPSPDWLIKIGCLVLAFVLLALYVVHAKRMKFPMLDMGVFKAPIFRGVMLSNALFRLSFNAYPFAIPLMLQVAYGYTALQSGFVTLFLAIGSLANRPVMALILRKIGYTKAIRLGAFGALVLSVGTIFIPFCFNAYVVSLWCFLYGFAISTLFASANTAAFSDVEHQHKSMATSVFGTMQQTASCFSVAIAALFLELLMGKQDLHDMISPEYFQGVFCILSFFALVGFVLFFRVSAKVNIVAR